MSNRIHIIPEAEHSYDIEVITHADGTAYIGIGEEDPHLEYSVNVELTDAERRLILKALQKPKAEADNAHMD